MCTFHETRGLAMSLYNQSNGLKKGTDFVRDTSFMCQCCGRILVASRHCKQSRKAEAAVTSSTAFNAPCFTFHIVRDTSLANPWDKLETYDLETGGWVYRHRNQAFHVTPFSY